MKLLSAALLIALSFSVIPEHANAQRFEGLIVNRIEASGHIVQQKLWVRGDSVLIEAQSPLPERAFANFATQELRVYMNKQPQVYALKGFDPEHKKTSLLQVQPGTQTIDGKTAQLYTIEIPTQDRKMMKTSFWLTPDFPANVRSTINRNLLIGNEDAMFRDIAAEIEDMGKAPVMIEVSVNDKESMKTRVVTATEQSIPLDKFAD